MSSGTAGNWVVMLGSPQGNPVHVFVTKNGSLREGSRGIRGWTWKDHGSPGGGGVLGEASALVFGSGETHVFVRSISGQLFDRTSANAFNNANPQWNWVALSAPPGTPIAGDPSGIAWGDGQVGLYAVGSDRKLYSCWRLRGVWKWAAHGKPRGTKLRSDAPAVAFVPGVAAVADRPMAWVVGTDGNLYLRQKNAWNNTWAWQKLGSPNGVELSRSVALALYLGSPDTGLVFAKGDDNHVWKRTGNSFEDCGFAGNAVPGPLRIAGLRPINGFPALFPVRMFMVDDPAVNWPAFGKVVEASFDGTAWTWTQHSIPFTPFLTNKVGVVAVPNVVHIGAPFGGPLNPYWTNVFVRAWNGHFYYLLCDDRMTPPWQPVQDLGIP